MYMDALAQAGVACGLDKDCAYAAAIASVAGSAAMLAASDEEPQVLIERVCSPGGTTIEGVHVLQNESFPETIKKAVEASYLKDKKL